MKTLIITDHILSQAFIGYGHSQKEAEEFINSLDQYTADSKGCYMPVTIQGCTDPKINIMPGYLETDQEE